MEITTNSRLEISDYIDHTLLKPETTKEQIDTLCTEAIEHGFAAVCVPPYYVEYAVQKLEGSKTLVATVIGFPLGYSTTSAKADEARQALDKGADELDLMINIAALKSGDWKYVQNDIECVTTLAHQQGKLVKVIVETGILAESEIVKACQICAEAGADFVKTSSGYTGTGATVEAVQLLRHLLPANIKIKATGGIRTRQFAEQLISAGAERLGTSSGITIIA